MKLEIYNCEFCGSEFPLLPIAFLCPECGLKHFFVVDSRSCTNELFAPNIKCPKEKVFEVKRRKGSARKKGPENRKKPK